MKKKKRPYLKARDREFSLREVAEIMGISQEHVRKLEERALLKLRTAMHKIIKENKID